MHVCAVACPIDLTAARLSSVLVAERLAWAENTVTGASLDHATFHAPFRADEWLIYVQEAPATSSARGLARGQSFRRNGRLAVSVVQEGLVALRKRPRICPTKPYKWPHIHGAGSARTNDPRGDQRESTGYPP